MYPAILIGVLGNMLEWYNFTVFGFFADTLSNQIVSLLMTLSVAL